MQKRRGRDALYWQLAGHMAEGLSLHEAAARMGINFSAAARLWRELCAELGPQAE